jgi:hypothetical protein
MRGRPTTIATDANGVRGLLQEIQMAPIKGFAGFDASAFPGFSAMAWLKANTNLVFTGFYLSPAPSHRDNGWMATHGELTREGWGFLPVFVGQQLGGPGSHQVSGPQGRFDGELAAALMKAAGFPLGARVFLDLEDGEPLVQPRTGYVTAWARAVEAAGWRAGAYCSHSLGEVVRETMRAGGAEDPRIWAFRVASTQPHKVARPYWDEWMLDPADPHAIAVQHDQNAWIDLRGKPLLVDLSTSLTPDPSACA